MDDTLGIGGAAVWAVETFGKGVGEYRLSGVATLVGGAILGRGHGLMGDAILNVSGAVLSTGAGR